MNRIFPFFFAFSLLVSLTTYAQENHESSELKVYNINGKEYYIHVVEKGNTLYSLSRLYSVSIEVLEKENPRVTTSLSIGDRLMIPLSEVKRKNLQETVDIDGNYIIYEVQRKNTLYSIAKEYNVEVNDIIAANPEVKDEGLKRKMKIRIPVAKIKGDTNQLEYITPAASNPYVTHLVKKKETLYSISKAYEVSVDSIVAVNKGLPQGLREGELINLPLLKNYTDSSQFFRYDSTFIKQKYRISLLLPFYVDKLEKANDTTYKESEKIKKELFAQAQYGVEFYLGFKMAADSLAELGMNIELNVFDTAKDTAKLNTIFADTLFVKSDLIVGPLYFDEFMKVADFAKKNKINIVSPVKQSNKILLGNEYVSKTISSKPVLLKSTGKYIADSLRHHNLIMVYPNNAKDRRNAELLKNSFVNTVRESKDTQLLKLPKEIYWSTSRFAEIKSHLVKDRPNIIIAPSEDKVFVTQFLSMMYRVGDYDVSVIGMEDWATFDNIDITYMQALKVHLMMPYFVNYEDDKVLAFEKKFYEQYDKIPERFSFLGYDVAWYYLSLLNNFGLNIDYALRTYQCEMLAHKFGFFKTGFESGYENHSIYVIRYTDYTIEQLH